jgi:hypothetical protein
LDVALDENGMLQCRAGILGQYFLWDRELFTVAKDAYSPFRTVSPVMEQLQLPAVLDRASFTANAEQNLQADVQQVVDVIYTPDFPQTEPGELYLPGQFQLLYYDPEGELSAAFFKRFTIA